MFSAKEWVCIRGNRKLFSPVSFSLMAGEILLIQGANGSGKTTLLRSLAGIFSNHSGSLFWQNVKINPEHEDHAERALLIGHKEPMKPHLSVEENLAFWADIFGSGNAGVKEALQSFALEHLKSIRIGNLSAGQKHRATLALLRICKRSLWLLDEPTANLDQTATEILATQIIHHREEGGIAIIATHDSLTIPDTKLLVLADPHPHLNGRG